MGTKDLPIWQQFPASEVQGVRGKMQLGAGSLHESTGVLIPVACFLLCPQLEGCLGLFLETGVRDLSRLIASSLCTTGLQNRCCYRTRGRNTRMGGKKERIGMGR